MPPSRPTDRAKPSSQKRNKSSADSSSSPNSSSSSPVSSFSVADGRDEVLEVWMRDLDVETKLSILCIEADEFLYELHTVGLIPSHVDSIQQQQFVQQKVAEVLNDKQKITKVREKFVDAVYKKGVIEIGEIKTTEGGEKEKEKEKTEEIDPVLLILFNILNQHLLLVYERHAALTRIVVFLSFHWWWISDSHFLLRYSLFSFFLFLSLTSFFSSFLLSYLLPLIDDSFSPSRLRSFVDSFLCCFLTLQLMTWISPASFIIALIAQISPIVLMYMEKWMARKNREKIIDSYYMGGTGTGGGGKRINVADENGLKYVRVVLLFASELILIYFAWYSWICLLFVVLFFLPSLTKIVLSSTLLALGVGLPLFISVQQIIYDWENRPIFSSISFGLSLVLFYFFSSSSSWLTFSFLLFLLFLFFPPLVLRSLSIFCTGLGVTILQLGVVSLVVGGLKVGAVLLFAIVVGILAKVVPKVVEVVGKVASEYMKDFRETYGPSESSSERNNTKSGTESGSGNGSGSGDQATKS